jgi:hypothetical protein
MEHYDVDQHINIGTPKNYDHPGIGNRGTRVVINFYSRLWEVPLRIAFHLLARPLPRQNWLTVSYVKNRAMRFANLVGNKFFSLAFSWLLSQPIKDTLCGTKVLRDAYASLAANRSYFGDYDLLFGAAKQGLGIVEIPVRYRERTYGETDIERWRHGWSLLKMCGFAAGRFKLV